MERIKKGDTVVVIRGNDKGKKGKVTRVMPRDGKVVIASPRAAPTSWRGAEQ